MEKRIKHASIMENVSCNSNLSVIKGEERHKNKDRQLINQQQ